MCNLFYINYIHSKVAFLKAAEKIKSFTKVQRMGMLTYLSITAIEARRQLNNVFRVLEEGKISSQHRFLLFFWPHHTAWGTSLTKDWTHAPCIGSRVLSTRSPGKSFFKKTIFLYPVKLSNSNEHRIYIYAHMHLFLFYSSIVDLQCCVNFCSKAE